VAGWVSYDHALAVVREHGESGLVARVYPGTIDGLIYSASMVLLDAARRKVPPPPLARWLLAAGIGATLAANIAAGVASGLLGAMVAAWPALALVGLYELSPGVLSLSHDIAPDAWRRPFATCLSHCGARYRRCSEARPVKTRHVCSSPAHADRYLIMTQPARIGGTPYLHEISLPENDLLMVIIRGTAREPAMAPAGQPVPGDVADAVRLAYRASVASGDPLSQRAMAERFGLS